MPKPPGLFHNCGFSHLMVLIGKAVKSAALLSYRNFPHYEQAFIQNNENKAVFPMGREISKSCFEGRKEATCWWLPPKQNRSDLQLFGIQFPSVQRGATWSLHLGATQTLYTRDAGFGSKICQ